MASFAHITVEPEDEDEIVIQAGAPAVAVQAVPEVAAAGAAEPERAVGAAAEAEPEVAAPAEAEPEVAFEVESEVVAEAEPEEPEIDPVETPDPAVEVGMIPDLAPAVKSERAREIEQERADLDAAPMSKMQKWVLIGAAVLVVVFVIYCIVCL